MLAGFPRDEEQRHQGWVGDRLIEVPDNLRQRRDEFRLGDHLGDVAGPDRLRGRDGHVDLREALPLEAGGERDQPRVVPDGQRGDRGGIDAPRQEGPHSDVGAHVLGHRVLENRGDLVIAGLRGSREGHRGETGPEVAADLGGPPGADDGVTAGFQAAHAPGQRLGLGNVLQDGVVLHGAGVDAGVQAEHVGQGQQALLLAADRRAARAGRHEQRLDAEGVAGAEQFLALGVPQREGEHAAKSAQRVGTPVVIGRDDGLTVAVGCEGGPVAFGQLGAQLEVVVDLAVEDQHVAPGLGRRAPAQRLVRVGDVDDRQPIEPQYRRPRCAGRAHVRPGPRLVGAAVAHQRRDPGHGVDDRGGDGPRCPSHQGNQSAHPA